MPNGAKIRFAVIAALAIVAVLILQLPDQPDALVHDGALFGLGIALAVAVWREDKDSGFGP